MNVIDLNEEHEELYCQCLEDWSEEIKEAGDHKKQWYASMKERGLRVKLATDDEGTVGAMIQYAPIEHSLAEGRGLCFIYCIWVHGHKQGRGDFQKRGMGTALLDAAESDARATGYKGMAAWGVRVPFWMRASWFKKHGYAVADRDGVRVLLWKPFANDAAAPRWIRQRKTPAPVPGKVVVSAFRNGWCPAQNLVFERAKRAASEPALREKIVFQEVDTSERTVLSEWGVADALFINGKGVRTGPPPSYERIKRLIRRRVKKGEDRE